MKAEQSALTQSLRTDLKNALEEVEAGNRRSRELEEFKGALGTLLWFVNRRADSILWGARLVCAVKAEAQLLRLAALTEQNQTLQSAIEDKDSLITRMRAEQQVTALRLPVRTLRSCRCALRIFPSGAAVLLLCSCPASYR
jgi:hypothetical protein